MKRPTSISGLLAGNYLIHLASDNWHDGRKRLWAELQIDEENGYSLIFVIELGGKKQIIQEGLAAAIRRYDEA